MSTLTWNSRRSQQEHPGAPVWLASPTNRPRPCLSGDGRPVGRADLGEGGIPDAESLRHGVPPRPRHHAGGFSGGGDAGRPAQRGRRV